MSAVCYRTATGSLRFSEAPPEGGEPVRGTQTFWFAVPSRWRVEDEKGVVHVENDRWRHVRDDQGRMQRMPAGAVGHPFSGWHPQDLLGSLADRGRRFTRDDDFSVPTGPGLAAEVAGRPAWRFELAPSPRKPHALVVTLDGETGTVLALAVPAVGSLVEMTSFVPDADLDRALFSWNGPVVTGWQDTRDREVDQLRWMSDRPLPVPRWWPSGPAYVPLSGNEPSGAYCVHLDVPEGGATLARWPVGGRPPRGWDDVQRFGGADEGEAREGDAGEGAGGHVHRWSDGTWEWALCVPRALSDEELRQVVSSIPRP